jgi:hypothetical protein
VRFLAKITIPKRTGDRASKSGELQRTVQAAMDTLKPEAAYFFEQDGDRECVFVVNLDVAAMIKPLFPGLEPSIYVTPVVNAAEFQQGLGDEESRNFFAQKSDLLADLKPVPSQVSESEEAPAPNPPDELASKRSGP